MVAWANAPTILQEEVIEPPPMDVLRLSVQHRIATYDCTYVMLARRLGVLLVTADKKLAERFKGEAVLLDDFAAGK